jgi:hypothetical protein
MKIHVKYLWVMVCFCLFFGLNCIWVGEGRIIKARQAGFGAIVANIFCSDLSGLGRVKYGFVNLFPEV